MALSDLKFEESDFVNKDISSLPDKVSGQAAFLKAKFDNVGKNMIAMGRFNELIDAMVDGEYMKMIYPVGSIYMSVNSTNPGTLFGGTWVAWGPGRVPVGINTGDGSFDTVEETGGEKTHTLNTNEMPEHDHYETTDIIKYGGSVANPGTFINGGPSAGPPVYHTNNGTSYTAEALKTTGKSGGGAAHNNLQPYIVCYMWKRTA